MSDLTVGQILSRVPDLPGVWSVWSKADPAAYGHSAFFVIPVEGHSGGGHAVVQAAQGPGDREPRLKLIERVLPKAASS